MPRQWYSTRDLGRFCMLRAKSAQVCKQQPRLLWSFVFSMTCQSRLTTGNSTEQCDASHSLMVSVVGMNAGHISSPAANSQGPAAPWLPLHPREQPASSTHALKSSMLHVGQRAVPDSQSTILPRVRTFGATASVLTIVKGTNTRAIWPLLPFKASPNRWPDAHQGVTCVSRQLPENRFSFRLTGRYLMSLCRNQVGGP